MGGSLWLVLDHLHGEVLGQAVQGRGWPCTGPWGSPKWRKHQRQNSRRVFSITEMCTWACLLVSSQFKTREVVWNFLCFLGKENYRFKTHLNCFPFLGDSWDQAVSTAKSLGLAVWILNRARLALNPIIRLILFFLVFFLPFFPPLISDFNAAFELSGSWTKCSKTLLFPSKWKWG